MKKNNQPGVRCYMRYDGIYVYEVNDLSLNTLDTWEDHLISVHSSHDKPVKQIYDLQAVHSVSFTLPKTIKRVIRIPYTESVALAIVVPNTMMWGLLELTLHYLPRNRYIQVFLNTEEAVQWLGQQNVHKLTLPSNVSNQISASY